jgi:hypothetical protein
MDLEENLVDWDTTRALTEKKSKKKKNPHSA